MFKGLSKYLAVACLAFPCLAQAVQVQDLRMPMTRTEADNSLSKDYDFTVLEDSTVRRLWHNSGRRITVDFDTLTDQCVCVRVKYDKPVSRKEAEADVEKICGPQSGKWSKTKKKAVEKIGISDKSLVKALDGGAFLFLEGSNKKFTCITYFAQKPKVNRWSLQPMPTSARVTAMGSTSAGSASAGKALMEDEQRRKDMQPTAIASVPPTKPAASKNGKDKEASSGKPSSGKKPAKPAQEATPSTPKPATPTPPRKRPAPVVVQVPVDADSEFSSGEVVETIEEIGFIKTSELTDLSDLSTLFDELGEAENFDEVMVILRQKITPTRAIVGGALLLVIILVLWSVIAKMRTKAKARANYKKILNGTPQVAGKTPVLKKAVAKAQDAGDAPADTAPAEDAQPVGKQDDPES